jgi:hypothetical protein
LILIFLQTFFYNVTVDKENALIGFFETPQDERSNVTLSTAAAVTPGITPHFLSWRSDSAFRLANVTEATRFNVSVTARNGVKKVVYVVAVTRNKGRLSTLGRLTASFDDGKKTDLDLADEFVQVRKSQKAFASTSAIFLNSAQFWNNKQSSTDITS